uniref:ATP-dependent Clp protease proteolytic subunit n=1 Tax=Torreya jiulongshanensis TaxID=3029022 RepID=A0A7D7KQ66_9CONI|nr:clp protease proteolytic subunit [Torreya jiulongshanensis]QMS50538.1 clp protease proteolytic subunit [Torreya jiulongshanensis]UPV69911.1 clp protease proteolytic subunit [Torreya jackii]
MDIASVPKVPFQGPGDEEPNWVELYHRLFRGRYLFLGKPLDKQAADQITKSLIYLNQENKEEDFLFFLQCRGGGMTLGVAVYDAMQYVEGEVSTIGIGLNASMGAFILHGGTLTKRAVTENARVMIHQPHMSPYDNPPGPLGSGFDAFYMRNLRHYVARIYAKTTKQNFKLIYQLLERDMYMGPADAIEFGLIDQIGVEGLNWPESQYVNVESFDDTNGSTFMD